MTGEPLIVVINEARLRSTDSILIDQIEWRTASRYLCIIRFVMFMSYCALCMSVIPIRVQRLSFSKTPHTVSLL